ncbi:MAG: SIS domain-containing protein [Coriobacteriia bacterium]|nr:SIS domain-containing protein [Coriobacteriia bacterium]
MDFTNATEPISNEASSDGRLDATAADSIGFSDYMLKEVYEQPSVVRNALANRLDLAVGLLVFPELAITRQQLEAIRHIYIVACGTSSHAGLIARDLIQTMTDLTVEVQIASEFVFRRTPHQNDTMVIAISQSGKTSDTLGAVEIARQNGAYIVAITNVEGSPITSSADASIYVHADVELAVPATKSYTAQLTLLTLFAIYLGQEIGRLNKAEVEAFYTRLMGIPDKIEQVLSPPSLTQIKAAAQECADAASVLFLSRTNGVVTCQEAALKLKEISYIHAEAFPALEFLHGPIALVDGQNNIPVIALFPPGQPDAAMLGVTERVKSYGAKLIALTDTENKQLNETADQTISLPPADEMQMPFVAVVALQLFAHEVGLLLGRDIDNPRYLSKAVTVNQDGN